MKKAEKTNKIVNQILEEEYSSEPGGLSGNDDAGQMSAWYVFAAMGLYPVCPGSTEYAVFLPNHEESIIDLGNGKTFSILADGVNVNSQIKKILLNGKQIERNSISHSDLIKGGQLIFELSNK